MLAAPSLITTAWGGEEIGGLGVDVLSAVKGALDPAGVLNPGALLA